MGGGSLSGLVAFCRRAFLYGLSVWEWGVGCFEIGVTVGGCVLLQGRNVRVGGDVVSLVLEASVGFACAFLRGWEVLTVLWAWLVSYRTRQVTYVSSSPVRTYFRCDLDSISAWCWVWLRVGMRPWYMVVKFMRSMCRPQVHPSVC